MNYNLYQWDIGKQGPLIWETTGQEVHACKYNKVLAAKGIVAWRHLWDDEEGKWLTWRRAQEMYGLKGEYERTAWDKLCVELREMNGTELKEWEERWKREN